MSSRRWRRASTSLVFGLLFVTSFAFIWRYIVRAYYQERIYAVEEAPDTLVAIVYGAAVYRNGRLSGVLRDRMDTAIALYQTGQVKWIIVSGDGGAPDYDEPGAMMAYAISSGVLPEDIQPDYGGNRTFDTCYRARRVFGVRSALLVTQEFHLPRALFICNQLGVKANGVGSDMRSYRAARWYEMRETLASVIALFDVVTSQKPAALGAAGSPDRP